MNRRWIPALLMTGLFGCASAPDVPAGFTLEGRDHEGLAIVSLTLSGKALGKVSSYEYHVRPIASRQGGETVDARQHFDSVRQMARWLQEPGGDRGADWKITVKGPDSAEPLDVAADGKPVGRVASLLLPAGDYEIYTWKLSAPNEHGNVEYSPKRAFSYRFAVKPGQAVYVGQINLRLSESETQELTLDDKRERDLALLRKKLPSLGSAPVASS